LSVTVKEERRLSCEQNVQCRPRGCWCCATRWHPSAIRDPFSRR